MPTWWAGNGCAIIIAVGRSHRSRDSRKQGMESGQPIRYKCQRERLDNRPPRMSDSPKDATGKPLFLRRYRRREPTRFRAWDKISRHTRLKKWGLSERTISNGFW